MFVSDVATEPVVIGYYFISDHIPRIGAWIAIGEGVETWAVLDTDGGLRTGTELRPAQRWRLKAMLTAELANHLRRQRRGWGRRV